MELQISNNPQIKQCNSGRLVFVSEKEQVEISIYSPSIIRVTISKHLGKAYQSFAVIQHPENSFHYLENTKTLEINTALLKVIVHKSPLRVNFFTPDNCALSGDDERFGTIWESEKVTNYRTLFNNEKFIGLGEKRGNLNRAGDHYVNWNTDAALHEIATDPLYKTFPFYIGLHNKLCYGMFFDNTHKSFFDFGASTNKEMMWFGAEGGDMNYYFFGSQTISQLLVDYTWLTGRMEMPPLWSLGYQQCRWSYMSADELLEVAVKFRERNIPADAIYCDIDYMDAYKIFTWDKNRFPNPKGVITDLNELGFKLVTIVDPGIKMEEGYKQYDEGVKNGYFAKYPNGENYIAEVWPGKCHFPNFYCDDVKKWWGDSFDSLVEPGVEGFWNDMNEPATWGQNIPSIVQFGDKSITEVRNAYGNEMSKSTYDGVKRLLNGKRPFVLTRAAYCGIQRYSAVWTGDNSATDDHMLYGQRLVNSLGLAGLSLIGVDIGGFSGNPTPELMVRWNSLGVYTPMFRNHSAFNTIHREPWLWGEENEAIIRKDIELRYKLLPYIYAAFFTSVQTGLPVSRTLAIDYTWDENIFDPKYQNQFLFGDSFLVAPTKSINLEQDVYLPEGEWYRFGSDEQYNGNQSFNVAAPLTNLPVFIKAGAIIPMQNLIQHTNEQGDGTLNIHIWNGDKENRYLYYEDDGISYNYENGEFYKRTIIFNPVNRSLSFAKPQGTFDSRFQNLKIVLHGFDISSIKICINGNKIPLNMEDNSVSIPNYSDDIVLNY